MGRAPVPVLGRVCRVSRPGQPAPHVTAAIWSDDLHHSAAAAGPVDHAVLERVPAGRMGRETDVRATDDTELQRFRRNRRSRHIAVLAHFLVRGRGLAVDQRPLQLGRHGPHPVRPVHVLQLRQRQPVPAQTVAQSFFDDWGKKVVPPENQNLLQPFNGYPFHQFLVPSYDFVESVAGQTMQLGLEVGYVPTGANPSGSSYGGPVVEILANKPSDFRPPFPQQYLESFVLLVPPSFPPRRRRTTGGDARRCSSTKTTTGCTSSLIALPRRAAQSRTRARRAPATAAAC